MSWRVLDAVFALLFLLAAVVQYNDPDPLLWIAMYLSASSASALSAARHPRSGVALAVGVVAGLWAATLLPLVVAHPPRVESLFGDAGMLNVGVEEAREMLGLCVVASWCAGVFARSRARSGSSASEKSGNRRAS
jgi:hypothetical protein